MIKISGNFFLSIIVFLSCQWASAQELTLEQDYVDQPLSVVLGDIQKISNIQFSFASQELEAITISIPAGIYATDSLLNRIITSNNYEWKFVSEKFVLIKRADWLNMSIQVRSTNDNEPLPFALIQINPSQKGVVTDERGTANLKMANDTATRLTISYLGYETKSIDPSQAGKNLVIELAPKVTALNEVVITEYLNQGIVLTGNSGQVKLYIPDSEVLPGLAEPDILLSTQMIPGISSANETVAQINVRGSSVDHMGYLWNEVPLYNPSHYFGNISAIIPSAVGEVDIYKNLIPNQFGGFMGGLIAIHTKQLPTNRITVETNLNLTHTDIHFNSRLFNLGSLMISARRSYNDLLLTPTYSSISEKVFEGSSTELFQTAVLEDQFNYNSEILFSDWNVTWNNRITKKDSIRISYLHAKDELDFESVDEDNFNTTRQLNLTTQNGFGVKLFHDWSPQFTTSVNFAYSHYLLDYSQDNIRENPGDIDQFESRENELTNNEVRLFNTLKISRQQILEFGYQMNDVQAGYDVFSRDEIDGNIVDEFESELKNDGQVNALFANYQISPFDKLTFGVGIRQHFYTFDPDGRSDPQLFITYQAGKQFTVKCSAGIAHQYLQSFQEGNFTLSNNYEQFWILAGTDEGREIMRNRQVSLGFIYAHQGWLIDLEAYNKSLQGLNARKINPVLDPFFTASEDLLGVDILLKKRFRNVRTWASYGYQNSKADIPGEGLTNIPSRQNMLHQVQAGASIHFHHLSFSSGYTFRSGLPFANAEDVVLRTTLEGIEFYDVDYESINDSRLPAYHRVDLSAWYHLENNLIEKFVMDIGISFLNLTNHKNYANRSYEVDLGENEEPLLIQTNQFLYRFTPNLSVRFKFL